MVESTRRGAAWTTLDQVASTASNSLVLVFISYTSGKDGLVGFSFAFTTYLVVLGLNRSFFLETSLVSKARVDRDAESVSLGASLVVGLVAGGLLYVVGALLDRPTIVALSVVLAGLLLQDAVRFIAFRRMKSRVAFEIDALWCLLLPALFLIPQDESGASTTFVWGVCACVAGLYGVGRLRVWPKPRRAAVRAWLDGYGRLGGALVADGLIFAFGQQLLILVVVQLSPNDTALADFRAGQTLIGPLAALFPILNMLVLPRLAQGSAGRRLLQVVSGASVITALSYTLILLAASDLVTDLLFDSQVQLSFALICLAGTQVLSYSFVLARVASLRARHAMREILISRIISAVVGVGVASFYIVVPAPEVLGASLAAQSVLFTTLVLHQTRERSSSRAGTLQLKEQS